MKRTPLKPVSAKTAARNRRYAVERRVFLQANPFCGVCGVSYATEVHHKAGRAPSVFFDQALWLPACRDCHQWVTDHPDAAVMQGFSVRRVNTLGEAG